MYVPVFRYFIFLFRPQTVAEKTVQLIEDESKNGEVVLLDHDLETKVVTFQEFFPTSSRQY